MTPKELEAQYGKLASTPTGIEYYFDGKKRWSLAQNQIILVGEHTTAEGPWRDDWFIDFIDREGNVFAFPWECASESLREQSAKHFGVEFCSALCGSTQFASRVIWPKQLAGSDLFRLQEVTTKSIKGMIDRLIGTQKIVLTDELLGKFGLESSRFKGLS